MRLRKVLLPLGVVSLVSSSILLSAPEIAQAHNKCIGRGISRFCNIPHPPHRKKVIVPRSGPGKSYSKILVKNNCNFYSDITLEYQPIGRSDFLIARYTLSPGQHVSLVNTKNRYFFLSGTSRNGGRWVKYRHDMGPKFNPGYTAYLNC